MSDFKKPNLTLPLVSSYNTRGVDSVANVAAGVDQRKVNSCYDVVKNSMSGNSTVYLVKRPGTQQLNLSYGASSQTAFIATQSPLDTTSFGPSRLWMLAKGAGSAITVQAQGGSATLYTDTGTSSGVMYTTQAYISGLGHLVVQGTTSSNPDNPNKVVYIRSTVLGTTTLAIGPGGNGRLAGKVEHLDGYTFYIETTGNIFNSDLNSLDTWPDSNFISKSIQLDTCVGLMKWKGLILGCGLETAEVFRNAGNALGSPLEAVPSMAQSAGVYVPTVYGSSHYNAYFGGRLYFTGRPAKEFSRVPMMFDGQSFQRIGNPAIDRIFTENEIYSVNKMSFAGKTAIAYSLSNITSNAQNWMMYFPEWNDWFEWNSTSYSPINIGGYHLGTTGARNKFFYAMTSTNVWIDDSQIGNVPYTMKHQFKLPRTGNNIKRMAMAGVVGDTASSLTTSVLTVSVSDDDYQTSTSLGSIDMTSQDKMVTRCGAYQDRAIILEHTGNTDCRLEKFVARLLP